ncbi:hypothetical protein PHYPSEUDO_014840 [Phytophthora pseudosyringae]|uniref:Uncharacterized protein n=1 Tax=Phytophthora pseudosyringae TaxID=221518 RepID=A0A8T1V4H0_9STRA|nr:hypothetical protein PHYPSEUDO_014840 [Phytophthora pseudosyringae]
MKRTLALKAHVQQQVLGHDRTPPPSGRKGIHTTEAPRGCLFNRTPSQEHGQQAGRARSEAEQAQDGVPASQDSIVAETQLSGSDSEEEEQESRSPPTTETQDEQKHEPKAATTSAEPTHPDETGPLPDAERSIEQEPPSEEASSPDMFTALVDDMQNAPHKATWTPGK